MTALRVFYEKKGRAKYISHLDVTRCMQRAIKRAELPVWYTEGFHPHIYLTFALPLSLGYESECESMDFRLTCGLTPEGAPEISFDEIRRRLNSALPPDIQVTRAAFPRQKPEAITQAVYALTLFVPDKTDLEERFQRFFSQEQILVEKRTKKGAKQVDIKPDCQLLSLCSRPGELELLLRTAAGPVYNVNPTLLTEAFLAQEKLENALTQVVRKAVLTKDGQPFE